jgi:hypothetical protein
VEEVKVLVKEIVEAAKGRDAMLQLKARVMRSGAICLVLTIPCSNERQPLTLISTVTGLISSKMTQMSASREKLRKLMVSRRPRSLATPKMA